MSELSLWGRALGAGTEEGRPGLKGERTGVIPKRERKGGGRGWVG